MRQIRSGIELKRGNLKVDLSQVLYKLYNYKYLLKSGILTCLSFTGVAKLIKADMVKPGATVIDVGITRITDDNGKTKLVGDVDYDGKIIQYLFFYMY